MAAKISLEASWKLLLWSLSLFVPLATSFLSYLLIKVHTLEVRANVVDVSKYSSIGGSRLDRSLSVLTEKVASEDREVNAIKAVQADHERRIQRLETRRD
jgi:hypothetical protein